MNRPDAPRWIGIPRMAMSTLLAPQFHLSPDGRTLIVGVGRPEEGTYQLYRLQPSSP